VFLTALNGLDNLLEHATLSPVRDHRLLQPLSLTINTDLPDAEVVTSSWLNEKFNHFAVALQCLLEHFFNMAEARYTTLVNVKHSHSYVHHLEKTLAGAPMSAM
jgi:hypothetical protein